MWGKRKHAISVAAAVVAIAVSGPVLADLVDQHFREGQQTGVRGTPSIYINGRKFQAPSRDVQTFKKLIDTEILKKG